MRIKQVTCIPFHPQAKWTANIIIGEKIVYFSFAVIWNSRSDSWHVTIKHDEQIIIQGVKLVLGVNLLALASSEMTPDCLLVPYPVNSTIERISYDNIINQEVKLYHIILGD